MKLLNLKSLDEQMLEQGYRNVTKHSTEYHSRLMYFGTYTDESNWNVTDECLAEPMKEAGLVADAGCKNIEAVLITFGNPKIHKSRIGIGITPRYERPYQVYVKFKGKIKWNL